MSVREEVAHLQRVALFSGVAGEHLNVLAFAARDRMLKDGKLLFKSGDKARALYVIISGEVGLYAGEGSKQQLIKTVGDSTMLGEMAVLCDRPHGVTARAVGESRILEIAKDLLFRSVAEFPEMGVQMMRVISARLAETTQDLARIQANFQTGVRLADFTNQEQQ